MDAHSATVALGLVNSAYTSVKTAFDLAKKTTDLELKHEVSKAFDSVLELKVTVYDLAEENRSLREQLAKKGSVQRNPEFGYYFADCDSDPLCPKCYESAGKLIHLPASRPVGTGIRRDCVECQTTFWERRHTPPRPRVVSRGIGWRGRNYWE